MELNIAKVVYLDESGFQYVMRRNYGRSVLGKRANVIVPKIRSKNISLCASIGLEGVLFFEIMDRPYNGEHFSQFIDQLLAALEALNKHEITIVMDSVRFHKGSEIAEIIQAKGHRLMFLPPYSPFLNPIEEVFAKWKHLVRMAKCMNEDELFDAIHSASGSITANDCSGYYSHMNQYIAKCLLREPILD